MNDKEYIAQKRRIQKLIKKWVRPLGLGWWTINFSYRRESSLMPAETEYHPKTINGTWVSAFITCADWCYQTATIECYLNILKDVNDDELEEYFVHELMHIFLSVMHTQDKAGEEELVATQLAKAFIWTNKLK